MQENKQGRHTLDKKLACTCKGKDKKSTNKQLKERMQGVYEKA